MHVHGGPWTGDKLEVMRRYFDAYAKALKNQLFEKWYIDAFAGTGDRTDSRDAEGCMGHLFGQDSSDIARVKDGSVRHALKINPPFDRYIFIDKSKNHIAALEELKSQFPNRKIDVREGDANQILRYLAKTTNWRQTRAAIFIDPYGMQIDWETLRILSKTQAVDIALLFPTGPLTRMLPQSGNIPEEWGHRIDTHLGPCNWREAAYKLTTEPDLFSSAVCSIKKDISVDGLRQFMLERLRSIFPSVGEQQLEMKNSRGAILYHLFIICANPNPKAKALSMKIAKSAVDIRRKV